MRNRSFQQTLRAVLALAVLSASAVVEAADCPAGDYPALVACAAAATAGDTITLSASIAAAAAPPLLVPVDVSLVNNGFALSGALAKAGAGTLTLNAANALSSVDIAQGTIAIGASGALGSGGALQMSGGRLLSTGNLNPAFASIDFTAGTSSTIAALTGQQIGFLGAAITLGASATANLGEAGNTGAVFIAPSGLSSADPTSMIRVGANLVMGNLNASLLTAQASSVTLDVGSGISSNGNPIEIGNLQGATIFSGVNLAGPSPQPLTIRGGSYKGTVNGNGFINKIGSGTLILGGQVIHTGGTTITAGTLQLGDGDGSNFTYATHVTNFGTLAFDTAGTLTMNGAVSGTGGVVKNGPGTLVLTNASNSHGGTTRINQGRLRFASATALGNGSAIEMNGGALESSSTAIVPKTINFIAGVNTLCAATNQVLTLAGDLQGDSSETRFGDCGAGTVELAGFPSLDPGALSINGNATLLVSAGFSGGNLFRLASSTTINAPSRLRLDSPVPVRIFNLQGTGTLTVAQSEVQIDIGSFDGVIEGAGALRQLSFSPPGLVLRGNNTYTGNTFVQGTLSVGDGGFSGSLGSGEISQSGSLTFNRADGLDIPNVLSGLGSIEFRGGGTFTLSGSGPNAGNFRPQANTTLAVTGTYLQARPQANAPNAVLRGTGTVQGFQATAGTFVEPGVNGATGIFTVDQPLLFGATFRVKLNGPVAGSNYDQLRALSFLSFQNNPPLLVTGSYLPAPGETFTIVDIGGSAPASGGTFAGLPEGALMAFGPGQLRISYAGGTGNDITLTSVAAPSAPFITTATLASPTSATVTFTAPGSDGASPILDYTAQCGAQSATGAGSPLVVTGLPAGPTTCVVRARNAVGTSPNSAALPILPGNFSFSGPSPTGTGTITTAISGGGAACQFTVDPSYIPVEGDPLSPPAGTAPQDVDFPHGLVAFSASGCTPGSTITLSITYPAPLPAGASYRKYGPRPTVAAPGWYVLGATLAGDTVTLSITDGGLGDSDLAADGAIVDPGGVATPRAVADAPFPDFTGIAFQGLWWAGPEESGWGVNTTHQGDILFATWFTYDANEDGQWFVMPQTRRILPGTYAGPIFVTRGPAFDAVPFDPRRVERQEVGEGIFQFTSASQGKFIYTLNGIRQEKRIVRQTFGNLVPECRSAGLPAADRNYQDLWWNPAESGWGLNLTHQGNVIFATWFTYDRQGKAQWLVMSNLARVGTTETFTGTIYRTQGNPFNSVPWDADTIDRIEAGVATLSFSGPGEGTFLYTLDGVTMAKAITRQEFAAPRAICSY